MAETGSAATCLPTQLDGEDWETVVFFQVAGRESMGDRRRLSRRADPVPLGLETDLIEHPSAGVVVLRFEVHTVPDDPLVGEVLLTPGESPVHFDTLKLLSQQQRLCWFIGDQDYNVLQSRQHPLEDAQREAFGALLSDVVRHDSMVRMTARYDSRAALSEIVGHYELRAGTRETPLRDREGQ